MSSVRANSDGVGRNVHDITDQFTESGTAFGEPVYNQDGVIAYSPEQAQTIFKNLMVAKVKDTFIPMIPSGGGFCPMRSYQMIMHMLHCQHVEPDTIGNVVSVFRHTGAKNMADYVERIKAASGNRAEDDYKIGFVAWPFSFHTAPTVRVYDKGKVSHYVLDPSLCSKAVPITQWANAQRQSVTEEGEFDSWYDMSFTAPKNERLSLYHRMRGDSKIERLFEVSPAEDNELEKLFSEACPYMTPSPAELVYAATGSDALGFEQHLKNSRKAFLEMAHDRQTQADVIKIASESGCNDLPNCGPLALKAVNKQLHSPGIPPFSERRLDELKRGIRRYPNAESYRDV